MGMVVGSLEIVAALTLATLSLWRVATHRRWRRWERDRRLELEAYCLLEITLPMRGDPRKQTERAKRVARLVTGQSVFTKCALFLQDEAGDLACAGSCGIDDLSLEALGTWCGRCVREESGTPAFSKDRLSETMRKSFPVRLSDAAAGALLQPACSSAILIPVRLQRGKLVGMLAVCGSREARLDRERAEEAVAPLELLAAKLARTLERAMLMDRLIQVERLAGAAQLAAGAVEALSVPLRGALDRAELIAGTTTEPRVREHARSILAHAGEMNATLSLVRDAWRPREELPQVAAEHDA